MPSAHEHAVQLCVPADVFALRANTRLNTALGGILMKPSLGVGPFVLFIAIIVLGVKNTEQIKLASREAATFLTLSLASVSYVLYLFLGPARRNVRTTFIGIACISAFMFILVMETPRGMEMLGLAILAASITTTLLALWHRAKSRT